MTKSSVRAPAPAAAVHTVLLRITPQMVVFLALMYPSHTNGITTPPAAKTTAAAVATRKPVRGTVNIASRMRSWQSSTEHGATAKLANDGNANPEFLGRKGGGSCMHTSHNRGGAKEWWASIQRAHTHTPLRSMRTRKVALVANIC